MIRTLNKHEIKVARFKLVQIMHVSKKWNKTSCFSWSSCDDVETPSENRIRLCVASTWLDFTFSSTQQPIAEMCASFSCYLYSFPGRVALIIYGAAQLSAPFLCEEMRTSIFPFERVTTTETWYSNIFLVPSSPFFLYRYIWKIAPSNSRQFFRRRGLRIHLIS